MRSDKSPREFFSKMKKKPALQKILDNLDDYTSEELENVQGQPLWIRKELIELQKRGGVTPEATAMQLANMMKSEPRLPESKNKVYRWKGCDWQMPCGRTGAMKIEVTVGDLFYVTETDDLDTFCLKLSSSIGYVNGHQRIFFLQNAEFLAIMTRTEFSAFQSESLTQQHQGNISTVIGGDGPTDADDRGLFRIIRHD